MSNSPHVVPFLSPNQPPWHTLLIDRGILSLHFPNSLTTHYKQPLTSHEAICCNGKSAGIGVTGMEAGAPPPPLTSCVTSNIITYRLGV